MPGSGAQPRLLQPGHLRNSGRPGSPGSLFQRLTPLPVKHGNAVFPWSCQCTEQPGPPAPGAAMLRPPRRYLIRAFRSASSSSLPKSRDTSSVSSTSACGGSPSVRGARDGRGPPAAPAAPPCFMPPLPASCRAPARPARLQRLRLAGQRSGAPGNSRCPCGPGAGRLRPGRLEQREGAPQPPALSAVSCPPAGSPHAPSGSGPLASHAEHTPCKEGVEGKVNAGVSIREHTWRLAHTHSRPCPCPCAGQL